MDAEQQQEIRNLRSLNLTPKQIARKLGLKVSDVSAIIKEEAEQTSITRVERGELAPVMKCLVNADFARTQLKKDNFLQKFLGTKKTPEDDSHSGLVMVTVARKTGHNRIEVCSYVVDVWCLGIKDTLGPRKVDEIGYEKLVNSVYKGYSEPPTEITLEQAQAIVFSALEYSAKLGFSPHRDFAKSRAHLGEWNGKDKIECGKNGKPFYINGPYDNPRKVVETLQKNVGEGNFDYMIGDGRP